MTDAKKAPAKKAPAKKKPAIPKDVSDTDREALEARYAAPFYCPGCGRGFQYPGECEGTGEAPHGAIQTVSTDELSGDPDDHTPAPTAA